MVEQMTSALLDPTFLFRFEVPIRRHKLDWGVKGLKLPESHRVPSLGALADRPVFADVRLAWDVTGLGLHILVNGKRQLPWCRDSRLEDSDGFQLWIDTRCSPNIHRATQYCHRFLWMPAGGGPQRERPVASLLGINRARSSPKPVPENSLLIHAVPRHDGYEMSGIIPAAAMTGYDATQQRRLGFYFAIIDRELGWQTFSIGPEFPVAEDPSLWGEASLVDK